MAKIMLGNAPKSFSRKVTFPLVDGGNADLKIEFKYRSRTQFAEFIDAIYPDLKDGGSVDAGEGVDVIASSKKAVDRDVAYILACVDGWDLDDELTESSVRQLVNEFPAAGNAIMTAYREAITEGRKGN